MFYNASIENRLRFGDVVKGYVSIIPNIEKPFSRVGIEVENAQYSVVLDPCCEIGDGTLILTPLEEVEMGLFDNPFLVNDLTSLNTEGMPKNFMHPKIWNKQTDVRKTELLNKKEFGQRTFFIYEGNPLFPEYTVQRNYKYKEILDPKTQLPRYETINEQNKITTRHRMICFKTIHKVKCQNIAKTEPMDASILGSIVLQLSQTTRELLRQKSP